MKPSVNKLVLSARGFNPKILLPFDQSTIADADTFYTARYGWTLGYGAERKTKPAVAGVDLLSLEYLEKALNGPATLPVILYVQRPVSSGERF